MKITGTRSYVKFDMENGYVAKAQGEMLADGKFAVYTNTMKFWEPPHEKEEITVEQIGEIMRETKNQSNESTVQIIFYFTIE